MKKKRAQFCKQWFEERGIDAKIDKMNNVVIKMFDDNQDICCVFVGILMLFLLIWNPLKNNTKRALFIWTRVGDDTANVVHLMR